MNQNDRVFIASVVEAGLDDDVVEVHMAGYKVIGQGLRDLVIQTYGSMTEAQAIEKVKKLLDSGAFC